MTRRTFKCQVALPVGLSSDLSSRAEFVTFVTNIGFPLNITAHGKPVPFISSHYDYFYYTF